MRLTIACGDYDRTRGLADGSVAIPGVELRYVALEPGELFVRAVRDREFEVAELSLSTYLNLVGRGDDGFVGIPVFPARSFRHGCIWIRRDGPVRRPEDLAGRRVGTMQYQLTVNLWLRGILEEDHGVAPEAVTWVVGGQEAPGGGERAPLALPPAIRVEPVPAGRTLNELLLDGAIDALASPHTPGIVAEGRPGIVRLWPDVRAVEQAWYRRTRLFPIMHLVVLRRDVHEREPGLAGAIFEAFRAAKAAAVARLRFTGTLAAMVPWLVADLEETEALMGPAWWPYGVAANRAELATATRWAARQGITSRVLGVDELFAPATLPLEDAEPGTRVR